MEIIKSFEKIVYLLIFGREQMLLLNQDQLKNNSKKNNIMYKSVNINNLHHQIIAFDPN